jgi:hypothetical protein
VLFGQDCSGRGGSCQIRMGDGMNFIRDRELAHRFRNGAVPSQERLMYFLIWIVPTYLLWTSTSLSYVGNVESTPWDIYFDIAGIVVGIAGTLICYRTNRSGDDKEFIERYTSLTFPIAVQVTLAVFAVVGGIVAAEILFSGAGIPDAYLEIVIGVLITLGLLYTYWRLNGSIKVASSA